MSRAWPVRGLDPDAPLAENARRILRVRMGELYAYDPIVPDAEEVTALHDMRIAAKRLRYTLELFRVVFGELGERQIERIKAIQEDLGAIHDHHVRADLIIQELRDLAAEEIAAANDSRRAPAVDARPGLLALLGRQRAARRARHQAFVELWTRLAAEGMRTDLVVLSAMPLRPAAAAGRSQPPTHLQTTQSNRSSHRDPTMAAMDESELLAAASDNGRANGAGNGRRDRARRSRPTLGDAG